jgi:hypothetical protein
MNVWNKLQKMSKFQLQLNVDLVLINLMTINLLKIL